MTEAAELLKSLAAKHDVPLEIAEKMAVLMQQYPDLSLWGSKPELIGKLEIVMEAAFTNKWVAME